MMVKNSSKIDIACDLVRIQIQPPHPLDSRRGRGSRNPILLHLYNILGKCVGILLYSEV